MATNPRDKHACPVRQLRHYFTLKVDQVRCCHQLLNICFTLSIKLKQKLKIWILQNAHVVYSFELIILLVCNTQGEHNKLYNMEVRH